MRFLLAVLLSFLPISASRPVVAQQSPAVLLLDATALLDAQNAARAGDPHIQAALNELRKQADRALTRGPYTVTQKSVPPPSGDVHDYTSLSIYWWPDASSPTGLPYVLQDGVRNPEVDDATRFDLGTALRMVDDVESLSLAYFLTGDERYAEHAADLLRACFLSPATRMNPNLQYSEMIPGRDVVRGTGIIEGRVFTRTIDSIALLAGCPCWTADDQQGMRQWFADLGQWMRTSPNGQKESAAANNHAVWYDVQLTDFALFTGDSGTARQVAQAALGARIDTQIAADGSLPHEIARTRSLHYSDFDLQAFAELATLSRLVGVDLWGGMPIQVPRPSGGIRAALDFLLPYWMSPDSWPYREITNVDVLHENGQTLRTAAAAYSDNDYVAALSQLSSNQTALDLLRLNLGYWPT